jgi:uncharacterized membrane protein YtjA (UPF0391 family)
MGTGLLDQPFHYTAGSWRAPTVRTGSSEQAHKEETMLRLAILFLIIALIAAIFGFGGISLIAAEIARILFFIFLVLFIISLVAHLFYGRRPPAPPV